MPISTVTFTTNITVDSFYPTDTNIDTGGIYGSLGGITSGPQTPSGVAPDIVRQPVSQAAVLNSNVAFQVTAVGTAPLAYQWRSNGQNISAATNSTFAIGSMQASNAGVYTVVVTNNFGAATSDVASLSVVMPPEFLWARIATNVNNTGVSEGTSMAIDAFGNVFVAGDYQGYGVDFGGVMFTNDLSKANSGNFICKYDANGNLLWARQYGTNWYFRTKLATDSAGSVYMAGDYLGTIVFGTNVLSSGNQQETYLAKFDSEGNALWVRRIGAYDPFQGWPGRALATDSRNGIFLVGACTNTADFGITNLTGFPAYLAKYDANGNFLWASGVASRGAGVAIGASGMIYVSGTTLSSAPSVLAKYGAEGQLIWSRPFPNSYALALDGFENIYVSGFGNGTNGDLMLTNSISNFFLAKCSPEGALLWSRQIVTTNQFAGISLGLDNLANSYVAIVSASLHQESNFSFGSSTLNNFISAVLKYDAAGNPLWVKSLGGTNAAQGWATAVLKPGAVYVAGTFSGFAQFGTFSFTTPNKAMYVLKMAGMEAPGLPQITSQPQSQNVRAGTTASFNVTVPSGIPLMYQWYLNGWNAVSSFTNASLVFTNVQKNASGSFQVAVANAYGSVTSSVANLTVYLTEAAALSAPIGPSSSGNPMQFQITGVAGFNYAVEASTNLSDWIPQTTNTSPFLFSDPSATIFPNRFYRVRWVPVP